jgi:hypothetical protein
MTPQTRELQLGLIRQLKGVLTVWEKWLQAEHEASLPEGTPADVMDILTKSKTARDRQINRQTPRPD